MSIKEREVKKILQECSIPKYDEKSLMKTIELINKNYDMVRFRSSNKEFILSQISCIKKRTWVLQIFILSFLCMTFYNMSTKSQAGFIEISLIAILAPLLVIVNIDEISRIYNRSMLEIEYSTKNSLKKVLVTRMSILGVMDSIALIIMMIFASNFMNISIVRVIVYTLLPFNLVCIGSLELMKYFKGTALNYACTVYSILMIAILLLGRSNRIGIYANEFTTIWSIMYVITVIVFAIEIKFMINRLDSFDKVIREVIIWI